MEFKEALRELYREGHRNITAQFLADKLYPDCRDCNSNGQRFNLASGVAGRMLRERPGCREIYSRVWRIIPEFIGLEDEDVKKLLEENGKTCDHDNAIDVGVSSENIGRISVDWCPDCGALKRTMTNWAYTDYEWQLPGESTRLLRREIKPGSRR